jgi:hypothetical protein
MPSVGINKDYQATPYGQRGGLNTFPAAGVISGFEISLGGTDGVGTPNTSAAITIQPGKARYEGNLVTLATALSVSVPVGVNLSTATTKVEIYMNPPRQVPVFLVGATPPTVVNGGYAIRARAVNGLSYGEYYLVDELLIGKAGAWEPLDHFSEIPYASDWNGLPFNEVGNTITAANISANNEVPIFLDKALPPHVASGSNAMLRQSGGIMLGEISFTGGVGTITKTLPDYHLLSV